MNTFHLAELAVKYQTPLYLFDLERFKERAALVAEAFGPDVGCCYSVKANPFLLAKVPGTISRFEVCSPGEFQICAELGIDPDRIIYSGVNKESNDIQKAIRYGVRTFTAESTLHLQLLEAAAHRQCCVLSVLLRLTSGSQFGMDGEVLLQAVAHKEQYPDLSFTGIHFFSGTRKKKASAIGKELEHIRNFLDRVEEQTGIRLMDVEYGTGMNADYFSADPESADRALLSEVAPLIRKMGESCRLTVEMGRFYAAPAGFYVTKVMDVKTNKGYHYAICDGGIHQLHYDGQAKGLQTPPVQICHLNDGRADSASSPNGAAESSSSPNGTAERSSLPNDTAEHSSLPNDTAKHFSFLNGAAESSSSPNGTAEHSLLPVYTLCGSLCTTADVLATVRTDHLVPGDLAIFGRCGAYSVYEGMSLFLSRDLPAVVLCKAEGSTCVRGHIQIANFNMADIRR